MEEKKKLSSKEIKKIKVKNYQEWLKNANTVILLETSLPAEEVWSLKKALGEKGATYHVVKNKLFSLALKEVYGVQPTIKGFTGAIFCSDDPIEPAKILWDLVKNEKATIKFGYYNKKEIEREEIEKLAKMPSFDELLGKLIYLIGYPIKGLIYTLQAPIQKFLMTLNAVKDAKSQIS